MPQSLRERLVSYLGPVHPDAGESLRNLDRLLNGESVQSVYLADRPGVINAEYYTEAIRNRMARDVRTVVLDFMEGRINAREQAESET